MSRDRTINHEKLAKAYARAHENPGEAQPIGRIVVCDICDEDWTDRPESGGFVFESKGVCPDCAPRFMKSVEGYGETQYIRARCQAGQSFADFIRSYRGPGSAITVHASKI